LLIYLIETRASVNLNDLHFNFAGYVDDNMDTMFDLNEDIAEELAHQENPVPAKKGSEPVP
jgi:hypothetical protein